MPHLLPGCPLSPPRSCSAFASPPRAPAPATLSAASCWISAAPRRCRWETWTTRRRRCQPQVPPKPCPHARLESLRQGRQRRQVNAVPRDQDTAPPSHYKVHRPQGRQHPHFLLSSAHRPTATRHASNSASVSASNSRFAFLRCTCYSLPRDRGAYGSAPLPLDPCRSRPRPPLPARPGGPPPAPAPGR